VNAQDRKEPAEIVREIQSTYRALREDTTVTWYVTGGHKPPEEIRGHLNKYFNKYFSLHVDRRHKRHNWPLRRKKVASGKWGRK